MQEHPLPDRHVVPAALAVLSSELDPTRCIEIRWTGAGGNLLFELVAFLSGGRTRLLQPSAQSQHLDRAGIFHYG